MNFGFLGRSNLEYALGILRSLYLGIRTSFILFLFIIVVKIKYFYFSKVFYLVKWPSKLLSSSLLGYLLSSKARLPELPVKKSGSFQLFILLINT